MDFLQTVVNSNRQRAHMTYRMKDVSDDGFIINFLSVMQQLAVRVKVNQVSYVYILQKYIHHEHDSCSN